MFFGVFVVWQRYPGSSPDFCLIVGLSNAIGFGFALSTRLATETVDNDAGDAARGTIKSFAFGRA